MIKKISEIGVELLSTAKQVRETSYEDEVNGLISIGFKLVSVCPNKEENSFTYSLIWDGVFAEDVSEREASRIDSCWPFLPRHYKWIYNENGTVHSVEKIDISQ